jgi:hypothetical protein
MLTAAQICSLAAQISKGPGFLSQAGMFLQMVLDDLVLIRNLKINRVTQTIVVPANFFGPINLEPEYLRTYDLFYPQPSAGQPINAPGITIFLNQVTMKQYDAQFKDTSTGNYPYIYATDLSPQSSSPPGLALLWIYPQSSGIINLTHRFYINRPAIASPETSAVIPFFQFQDYLVKATAARLMAVTGDDRKDSFDADCERMIQPYLVNEGDEEQAVHNIELDPMRFRTNRSLRPTKSSPIP